MTSMLISENEIGAVTTEDIESNDSQIAKSTSISGMIHLFNTYTFLSI